MHPEVKHAATVAWAAQGHRDAMGSPFSDWHLARYHDDGRAMRDAAGRQMFMTHNQWLAKHGPHQITTPAKAAQQELFA